MPLDKRRALALNIYPAKPLPDCIVAIIFGDADHSDKEECTPYGVHITGLLSFRGFCTPYTEYSRLDRTVMPNVFLVTDAEACCSAILTAPKEKGGEVIISPRTTHDYGVTRTSAQYFSRQ